MSISAFALLQQRTYQVVQAAGLFHEFETAERFSLRVDNEPYMPLVVESWHTPDTLQGEKRRLLVAHYALSGERELPDPELEMTDMGFPIRLRQTVFGVMETPVMWRDPNTQQVMVNIRAKRDMAQLLRVWAKNIKEQGVIQAAARIVAADGAAREQSVASPKGGSKLITQRCHT